MIREDRFSPFKESGKICLTPWPSPLSRGQALSIKTERGDILGEVDHDAVVLGAVAGPDDELELGDGAGGGGRCGEGVNAHPGAAGGDHAESLAVGEELGTELGIAEAYGVGFDCSGVAKGDCDFIVVVGFADDADVGGRYVDESGVGGIDAFPDGGIPDVEIDAATG